MSGRLIPVNFPKYADVGLTEQRNCFTSFDDLSRKQTVHWFTGEWMQNVFKTEKVSLRMQSFTVH